MIPLSILSFGFAGAAVGAVPNIGVVLFGLAISGLLWTWILATMNSVFQMLTPDWVRGRTMAAFVLSVFGILPIGALAAGALGDLVGAPEALVVFSGAVALLGGIAIRLELPVLEEIVPPVIALERSTTERHTASFTGPVMVVSTWTIESPEEMVEFGSVLAELRRLRLATGAYRWNAYRTAPSMTRTRCRKPTSFTRGNTICNSRTASTCVPGKSSNGRSDSVHPSSTRAVTWSSSTCRPTKPSDKIGDYRFGGRLRPSSAANTLALTMVPASRPTRLYTSSTVPLSPNRSTPTGTTV